MKKAFTILCASLLIPFTQAQEKDHDHKDHDHAEHKDHDHDKIKAPNGGRIIHAVEPHVEFFITKERKVQITFIDDHGKAITSKTAVSAIGGKRTKPTKFTFEKTKTGFISKEKLPEGNLVPIVLTFADKEGKKKRVRFNVNMADCPTCEFKEYACTCDHDHDDHKGHDHKKGEHKDHKH